MICAPISMTGKAPPAGVVSIDLAVYIRAAGGADIASVIELGSTVHADEAPRWDVLNDRPLTKRI